MYEDLTAPNLGPSHLSAILPCVYTIDYRDCLAILYTRSIVSNVLRVLGIRQHRGCSVWLIQVCD